MTFVERTVVGSVAFKELNDVSEMAKLDVARTIDICFSSGSEGL